MTASFREVAEKGMDKAFANTLSPHRFGNANLVQESHLSGPRIHKISDHSSWLALLQGYNRIDVVFLQFNCKIKSLTRWKGLAFNLSDLLNDRLAIIRTRRRKIGDCVVH
jgi:hypothetical protein